MEQRFLDSIEQRIALSNFPIHDNKALLLRKRFNSEAMRHVLSRYWVDFEHTASLAQATVCRKMSALRGFAAYNVAKA